MKYILKIREERMKNKYPLSFIARRIGISRNYLSELEHNKYDIKLSYLLAISDVLKVEPSDLYTKL